MSSIRGHLSVWPEAGLYTSLPSFDYSKIPPSFSQKISAVGTQISEWAQTAGGKLSELPVFSNIVSLERNVMAAVDTQLTVDALGPIMGSAGVFGGCILTVIALRGVIRETRALIDCIEKNDSEGIELHTLRVLRMSAILIMGITLTVLSFLPMIASIVTPVNLAASMGFYLLLMREGFKGISMTNEFSDEFDRILNQSSGKSDSQKLTEALSHLKEKLTNLKHLERNTSEIFLGSLIQTLRQSLESGDFNQIKDDISKIIDDPKIDDKEKISNIIDYLNTSNLDGVDGLKKILMQSIYKENLRAKIKYRTMFGISVVGPFVLAGLLFLGPIGLSLIPLVALVYLAAAWMLVDSREANKAARNFFWHYKKDEVLPEILQDPSGLDEQKFKKQAEFVSLLTSSALFAPVVIPSFVVYKKIIRPIVKEVKKAYSDQSNGLEAAGRVSEIARDTRIKGKKPIQTVLE